MHPLTVLLTNSALQTRGGSETYLRDVAVALLRRGHRPVAFSLALGAFADELRQATIPVIDHIDRLGTSPDVIHGQHHLETLIAALAFPDVPIVHFCHGWLPWEERPLRHPAIRRYVAVDEVCADRMIREEGIAADQVEVLLNFVDLKRFTRRSSLPARPARALILSNHATADGYSRPIQAACHDAGIAVTIAGHASGYPTMSPETLFPEVDLVFAKGRSALEAMAAGCAVVLADVIGCGPLVTPHNLDRLRPRNFGVRELQHEHDAAWYAEQIAAYDAVAAGVVTERVRQEADLEPAIERLLTIYEDALGARPPADGCGTRAAAEHLEGVALAFKRAWEAGVRIERLEADLALARQERDRAEDEQAALQAQVTADHAESARLVSEQIAGIQAESARLLNELKTAYEAESSRRLRELSAAHDADSTRRIDEAHTAHEAEAERLRGELNAARRRGAALERTVEEYRTLTAVRLRDALVRVPIVGPAARAAARAMARRFAD